MSCALCRSGPAGPCCVSTLGSGRPVRPTTWSVSQPGRRGVISRSFKGWSGGGAGLDAEQASLLSGHLQAMAFVSAAIRLGFVSHIQAPTDCAADTPHADHAACHAPARVSQQLYAGL